MKRENCKKIRELAEVFHRNILEAGQTRQVEAHLAECPACRKDFEETLEVLTLFKTDRSLDPGPVFWNDLSSRIMTQVRRNRPEEKEVSWYRKLWINPFGWPGYAWATALILMLLTPVVIYNIHIQGNKTMAVLEIKGQEMKWESGSMPLAVAVESLSEKESVHLAKKVVARLGKDLPGPSPLLMEDDLQWDISRSLEGLNKQELETLIKKMEPGGSAGNKEEEEYVC